MALKKLFPFRKITKIPRRRPPFVLRLSFINLFNSICIAWGRGGTIPIEMLPMIKIMTTKPIVSLVSFTGPPGRTRNPKTGDFYDKIKISEANLRGILLLNIL